MRWALRQKLLLPGLRDSAFAERVYNEPDAIAAEFQLSAEERAEYFAFIRERNAAHEIIDRYRPVFDRSIGDFVRHGPDALSALPSSELSELCYAASWRAGVEEVSQPLIRRGHLKLTFRPETGWNVSLGVTVRRGRPPRPNRRATSRPRAPA